MGKQCERCDENVPADESVRARWHYDRDGCWICPECQSSVTVDAVAAKWKSLEGDLSPLGEYLRDVVVPEASRT